MFGAEDQRVVTGRTVADGQAPYRIESVAVDGTVEIPGHRVPVAGVLVVRAGIGVGIEGTIGEAIVVCFRRRFADAIAAASGRRTRLIVRAIFRTGRAGLPATAADIVTADRVGRPVVLDVVAPVAPGRMRPSRTAVHRLPDAACFGGEI